MTLKSSDKWRFTLYTSIVVVLLFNPTTYKFVNSLLANLIGRIADQVGCPTQLGFLVHVIVFTLVIRYLMDIHH